MKFAIVGTGWRARFFIRIAKHYSDKYEVTGVLCRNQEKVKAFSEEYGIKATMSEEEIVADHPDFIVVAVNKASLAEVSTYWRTKGYTVLCETPVGLTKEELISIYENQEGLGKLIVAEQYQYYPTYKKIIDTVQSGIIGTPTYANVSLCHDYHGASLIRLFLGESYKTSYRVMVHNYTLPVTKTGDRYRFFTDGEVYQRTRTVATIAFADQKTAVYDFDGEQYHSVIRHNSYKITGERGELIDNTLWYLDEENVGQKEILFEDLQAVRFEYDSQELSQDEQAIEVLMEKTYEVSRDMPGTAQWQEENLNSALADAYFMLLLQGEKDVWIEAEQMPWTK